MINDFYDNIPKELTSLKQWVTFRIESDRSGKPTKRPYNPATGQLASVTDGSTWVPFEFARDTARNHPEWYDGIGFVLTKDDPYCFVDLDDTEGDTTKYERQLRVYEEFKTYAEISPSGKGCHLILKGSVPSGRRRDKIEVYSSERYMTMTGNVVGGVIMPINDTKQEIIDILWEELGDTYSEQSCFDFSRAYPEKYTDQQIYEFCCRMANGELFQKLWFGQWHGIYPSQSEADLVICNIMSLFTDNIHQLERLFHASELGKREKAHRKAYLYAENYGILRMAMGRKLPPVDTSQLHQAYNEATQQRREAQVTSAENQLALVDHVSVEDNDLSEMPTLRGTGFVTTIPPGIFGEMCQFFYEQAKYPIAEYAVTGAMGYATGILARHNNISKMGLNQYFVNVGGTGTGKEGPVSAIAAIQNQVCKTVESASLFIGPSELVSKEGIFRELSERPCFTSIQGEISEWIQQMVGPRPSPHIQGIKKLLLELYGKSGQDHVWSGLARAKKESSINGIRAVNLSFIGDTTPEGFYRYVTEDNIRSGLFPRFTIVENYSERPQANKNFESVYPKPDLVSYIARMCDDAHNMNRKNAVRTVILDPWSRNYFEAFEEFCDEKKRKGMGDAIKELWTRTNMRALKTAALIAAFNNYSKPCITTDIAKWAVSFIENTTNNLIYRSENFTLGETYKQENSQYRELMRVCVEWAKLPWTKLGAYRRGSPQMHKEKVIPYSYIHKRLIGLKHFREDRMGASYSIKRCIEAAVMNGDLVKMRELEIQQRYSNAGMCYTLGVDAQV